MIVGTRETVGQIENDANFSMNTGVHGLLPCPVTEHERKSLRFLDEMCDATEILTNFSPNPASTSQPFLCVPYS